MRRARKPKPRAKAFPTRYASTRSRPIKLQPAPPQPTLSAKPATGQQGRSPRRRPQRSKVRGVSFDSAQPDDRLHVKCLRKKIEHAHLRDFVAALQQRAKIA